MTSALANRIRRLGNRIRRSVNTIRSVGRASTHRHGGTSSLTVSRLRLLFSPLAVLGSNGWPLNILALWVTEAPKGATRNILAAASRVKTRHLFRRTSSHMFCHTVDLCSCTLLWFPYCNACRGSVGVDKVTTGTPCSINSTRSEIPGNPLTSPKWCLASSALSGCNTKVPPTPVATSPTLLSLNKTNSVPVRAIPSTIFCMSFRIMAVSANKGFVTSQIRFSSEILDCFWWLVVCSEQWHVSF